MIFASLGAFATAVTEPFLEREKSLIAVYGTNVQSMSGMFRFGAVVTRARFIARIATSVPLVTPTFVKFGGASGPSYIACLILAPNRAPTLWPSQAVTSDILMEGALVGIESKCVTRVYFTVVLPFAEGVDNGVSMQALLTQAMGRHGISEGDIETAAKALEVYESGTIDIAPRSLAAATS